jgi:uncharacterized protein (TIGR00296 family)
LFVTWEGVDGRLRGCIGSLSRIHLSESLGDYAIKSGIDDSRFSPIDISELSSIKCTVSILHSFQKCDHHLDWVVGLHGITVEFTIPSVSSRVYRATFLPKVAQEQGWTNSETIKQAVCKSGFTGNLTSVISYLTVTRYMASTASMSYSDFIKYYGLNIH